MLLPCFALFFTALLLFTFFLHVIVMFSEIRTTNALRTAVFLNLYLFYYCLVYDVHVKKLGSDETQREDRKIRAFENANLGITVNYNKPSRRELDLIMFSATPGTKTSKLPSCSLLSTT